MRPSHSTPDSLTTLLTRTLVVASLATGIALSSADPVRAWDGEAGELALLQWEPTDFASLAGDEECWLLTRNGDLAVLLVSPEWHEPASLSSRLTRLEAAKDGAYYLMLCADGRSACFGGTDEVLARLEHVAVVRTDGEAPKIERSSIGDGLVQPVYIDFTPKPWPDLDAADRSSGPLPATEFEPMVASIAAAVDETQYVAVWQVLDDFETRYVFAAPNEAASQWMYDLLASYGLDVEFFSYQQSGQTKRDVVATLVGTTQPEKVVYMTGHFDSISSQAETHAPGADDNGSGTAAFLEAARVLSGFEFDYTIKFVGFNGEEQGLYGSRAYTAWINSQGEDVVGCFNLDMIAYRGNDPGLADFYIYTDPGSMALAQILSDACLAFVPELEPVIREEALGASDHAAFWDYGYAALMGIEDRVWSSDFCPWYHTVDDRIEQYPTDFPTWCTRATVAAVAHMAGPIPSASGLETPSASSLQFTATPNPVSNGTTLTFVLEHPGPVTLSRYDATGRQLGTIVEREFTAGTHSVTWDGGTSDRDEPGSAVSWLRLETQDETRTLRIVSVR